jgi:hypothetical protein
MKPTQKLAYTSGLHSTLGKIGASMRDPYAWVAWQDDMPVLTIEVDHRDQERNRYSHLAGTFHKIVPALSKEGSHASPTVRHAQELLETVVAAQRDDSLFRVLLIKGTKNGTSNGAVKAAVDGDLWRVREVSGTVAEGYEFIIYRAEENSIGN